MYNENVKSSIMKRIPSITPLSLLILALSCHLPTYAKQLPSLEEQIIAKGNKVNLWGQLKKEVLKDARLVAVQGKEEITLFDNITKRHVLALAKENGGKQVLQQILTNKINTQTIKTLLDIEIVEEAGSRQASNRQIAVQEKTKILRDELVEQVRMFASEGRAGQQTPKGPSATGTILQKEGLTKQTIWGLPALYVYGLLGMLLLLVFILCVGVITRGRKKKKK